MLGDARFLQSYTEKLQNLAHLMKETKSFLKFLIKSQEQILLLLDIKNLDFNHLLPKLINEHQKHMKRLANVDILT